MIHIRITLYNFHSQILEKSIHPCVIDRFLVKLLLAPQDQFHNRLQLTRRSTTVIRKQCRINLACHLVPLRLVEQVREGGLARFRKGQQGKSLFQLREHRLIQQSFLCDELLSESEMTNTLLRQLDVDAISIINKNVNKNKVGEKAPKKHAESTPTVSHSTEKSAYLILILRI